MKETIDIFDRDCKKLPGQLKQWDAFKELKEEIESMKQLVGSDNDEITGVVKALAKPTIKDRHWQEIIDMCKCDIPYDSDTFNL
jgi:dynein heavy chain